MATKESSKMPGIEDILTDTAEVQLATFNAGIEFWSKWVKQTSALSKNIEKNLNAFKNNPNKSTDILLEINEANREYMRDLNSLPRDVANKFVTEMDRLQKKKKPGRTKSKVKPKRRARVKV